MYALVVLSFILSWDFRAWKISRKKEQEESPLSFSEPPLYCLTVHRTISPFSSRSKTHHITSVRHSILLEILFIPLLALEQLTSEEIDGQQGPKCFRNGFVEYFYKRVLIKRKKKKKKRIL